MKRTAFVIEESNRDGWVLSDDKITCYVYGEMSSGTKVWMNIDTADERQYGLLRMQGAYYFYKM